MADLGNQLEGAGSGLERLTEGFDNLVLKLSGVSQLEAKIIKEKQAINKQLDKINKDKIKEEKKALPLQKRMTVQLQQRLKNTTLLNKGLKETIKGMTKFNKGMGDMAKKGLGKGLGVLKGAMKAGAIGAAVMAIKAIVDGLLQIDGMMAKMVQATGRLRSGLDSVREIVLTTSAKMSDLGISMEQAGAEAANMTQHMGTLSRVTADLVVLSLLMQKGFGMGAEQSGQLLESLTRINVNAREFVETLREDAVMAGTNVSLVMRNVATITKDISIQNERSLESLKAMAV